MAAIHLARPGREALKTLARRLDELRPDSPLDPVVVVCPTPIVAVSLRRQLARLGGGVAGLSTETVPSLVSRLLAATVEGESLRMASKPEIMVALRAELAHQPGRFGAVADHRTTDERLLAVQQELVGVGAPALALMEREATGLSSDALRVVRRACERDDIGLVGPRLIDRVLERLDRLAIGEFGPIIVYQPEPLRPLEGRVVAALAGRADSELLVTLTGDPDTDDAYLDRLAGWGVHVPRRRAVTEMQKARVTEAPDPEEEVRVAIRSLMAQAVTGTSLADTAILYTRRDPYARLLSEHLEAAGIPFGGPGYRPLAHSLTGRTLRRLLDLAGRGLGRHAVMTFLAAAPIDAGDGTEVPATTWDVISRQAGIVDEEHWELRLAALTSERAGGELGDVARLGHFVEELATLLTVPDDGRWSSFARWSRSLLDRYVLVDEHWPDGERTSRERLHGILDDLGEFDRLGSSVDLDGFVAVVESELESLLMPGRPLGTGVYVGPVNSVAGLAFDQIAVVGLVEGVFPRTPLEDPLLTDQLRSKAGLLEKGLIAGIDCRSVAVAAASSLRPALFTTSRGDLRSNRSRTWPRRLDRLVEAEHRSVDSYWAGTMDHGRPVSQEELGLRSLTIHVDKGEPVNTHHLATADQVLARSLTRNLDRVRSSVGPFTGLVGEGRIDPLRRPLSPTALETYARCPRSYLLNRVLRISEDERPERHATITPLQLGNLVHAVLEQFLGAEIEDGTVPEPGQFWSPEHRFRLLEILDREVKHAEAMGFTGGQVMTILLRRRLIGWMHNFLDQDDKLRADYGSTPVHVEFSFGFDAESELSRWGDREMRLRGYVDRVDVTADGGVMVIDYKTGRNPNYVDLQDNPLKEGTRLQLPLYANDVAERLGLDGPRRGVYWELATDAVHHVPVDAALDHDLNQVVGTILDGITSGLFPAVPGEVDTYKQTFHNCRYCDYDRICPTDRQREWHLIRTDVALQPVRSLVDPEQDEP